MFRTGVSWLDLPKRYPPYQTGHRRFQQWSLDGILEKVLTTITEKLEKCPQLNMSVTLMRSSLRPKTGIIIS
ncbi:transposase [Candidatus Poribacteria bacterium]|nr:transposase [Candidatus Poribacteria bacterium]